MKENNHTTTHVLISNQYAMELKELFGHFAHPGTVTWISIRPKRQSPVEVVNEVEAIAGKGLAGDRYNAKDGTRQITLIQHEHLDATASILRRERIDPALVRRNIVVQGINLGSLKGKRFQIGTAILEYSGECHPCSRMEENLGFGGYNAMRGHGGITARVITSGIIRTGDSVIPAGDIPLPDTNQIR
jgi:MOSC domain-containing protein YiiM